MSQARSSRVDDVGELAHVLLCLWTAGMTMDRDEVARENQLPRDLLELWRG